MLLAGDVGGTKTHLGVFTPERGPLDPVAEVELPSADYASLEELIRDFLSRTPGVHLDRAVLGVAGPVVEGRVRLTNLPWVLESERLREELSVGSVELINDLAAIAYTVPALDAGHLHTLQPGRPVPNGPVALVAPGTGLGEAFLTWDGTRYEVHPSEGGHSDFAPRDPVQLRLLGNLLQRLDHVSYERVCSGRGIPNLYRFVKESGDAPEPDWLTERLAAAEDPTPVLLAAALEEGWEPCERALRIFASILGAKAGNLALTVLATGGVYLAGGIPRRVLRFLREPTFLQAFQGKGRLSGVLERVPVHVVLLEKVALLGAARRGLGL